MAKILCICLSSTIQRTINFNNIRLEKVNRSTSYRMDASGKALNSARVLSQLEKDCVQVICPVGEKNKDLFVELAERDNLTIDYVTIPGFTRECWTLLDNNAGTTTEMVVGEPELDFDIVSCEEKILDILKTKICEFDAVLFAGSKPKCFSEHIVSDIAKASVSANKVFLADYQGLELLNTLKNVIPSIIKINEEEFVTTFNLFQNATSYSDDELKMEIQKKSVELNNIVVVTRGHLPTFASNKGEFVECPVEKVKAVNTTACGDSFSAGFLYEYVNTGDFKSALKKGTWCAARNAELETPGAVR